jgi:WD40 repeat protein
VCIRASKEGFRSATRVAAVDAVEEDVRAQQRERDDGGSSDASDDSEDSPAARRRRREAGHNDLPEERDTDFHTKPVTCLVFAGNRIVSGSMDCSVRVWNALDYGANILHEQALPVQYKPPVPPVPLFTLRGHSSTITALAMVGHVIASGSADLRVMLWNAKAGNLVRQMRGFEASVTSISLLPSSMVCASADGALKCWTLDESAANGVGVLLSRFGLDGSEMGDSASPVTCVAHTLQDVVCGHKSGVISIRRATDGAVISKSAVHTAAVTCLQYDVAKVVSGGFDNTVRVTDLATGHTLRTLTIADTVIAVQFDTVRLLCATRKGDMMAVRWYA